MIAARRPSPPVLDRLTSLRAFAALAVFGYHLYQYHVWGPDRVAATWASGVSFFFVLSGFILVWSTRPGTPAQTFYGRRFARIYPSFLVMFIVAAIVPVVPIGRSAPGAVCSVLLVQAWVPVASVMFSFNGVAWTLSCEGFFYALFPRLLARMVSVSPRTAVSWAVAAFAVIDGAIFVVAIVMRHDPGSVVSDILGNNPVLRLPEFVLGMAAAIAFRSGYRAQFSILWPTALLPALMLADHFVGAPSLAFQTLLPPIFVAIILAAATRDAQDGGGWLSRPLFVYAGQVSFCFYLVHELAILNLRPYLGGLELAVASLLAAVAGACLLHHCVELPMQRVLRPKGQPAVGSEGAIAIRRAAV